MRKPFAEFARRTPYEVRFIEFMPLDADHAWTADQVLTGAEIRAAIDAVYPLEAQPREPPATARVSSWMKCSENCCTGFRTCSTWRGCWSG